MHAVSYRPTIRACYLGTIVQAIVINLTSILFIPLREQFGFSYQQLGLLVFINFITQVSVDLLFGHPADRYGFRPFIVAAPVLTIIGFVSFALIPTLMPAHPYAGFVAATIIFSGAGGLLELLLSPIVNAIPNEEKATAMSVLHSFYAWGWMGVVLITTVLLWFLGREQWPWIVAGWCILPAVNFFQFLKAPLAPPVPHAHRLGLRVLLRRPFFLICALTILLGGASEIAIAQWTSAFLEKAMLLPKLMGDTAGVCLLAGTMGLGRLLYGLHGARIHVARPMRAGALLAVGCYLTLAFSHSNGLSLLACGLCGLAVSLLWPGTLSLAAERFPLAGAWLFAILAATGDIGAAVGPYWVGLMAEVASRPEIASILTDLTGWKGEALALRAGLLAAALFPLAAYGCLLWLKRHPAPTQASESAVTSKG